MSNARELIAMIEQADRYRNRLAQELRAVQLSELTAPDYITVPTAIVSDAQLDALFAREQHG